MFFPRTPDPFSEKNQPLSTPHGNGYLLLEILFAVAIFSIGALAVGTLIISAASSNTSSNILTQATFLAAETLESLKKEAVSDLVPNAYQDPNNPINEWGSGGGIFNRNWIIDDPIGYNTSRRIRVTVSWDRLGQGRRVELTTITRGNGS